MNYSQITCEDDRDIPYLHSIYKLPEIARYISIDDKNYWRYVTTAEDVFFYKVYDGDSLVGAIHCELSNQALYMDITVIPQYPKKGIGTHILQDILMGKLPLDFDRIEVSIDASNTASVMLFEKMNFHFVGKEDELLTYVFLRQR